MRISPRLTALLTTATLLCGCTTAGAYRPGFVAATQAEETERRTQSLLLEGAGQQVQLIGVLELNRHSTSLAAVTPQGMVLFSVDQTARHTNVQRHPDLPAFVDIEQVLADVRLVNWPTDALRTTLRRRAELHEDEDSRGVVYRGELISEARFEPSIQAWHTARLHNLQRGYRLTVRSI